MNTDEQVRKKQLFISSIPHPVCSFLLLHGIAIEGEEGTDRLISVNVNNLSSKDKALYSLRVQRVVYGCNYAEAVDPSRK